MPSNEVSQYYVWNESCKDAKEKEKTILTHQNYDEHIAKSQSWNPIHINIIKNFINIKNNNFRVEGFFFKLDGENGRNQMRFDKSIWVTLDGDINFQFVIDYNLNFQYIDMCEPFEFKSEET